ncbi:vacuolar protein sorting-associated protein [Pelomyxa schiedti]|nr:vacuolar protein sorting-associated protein [Pelomyxa schiedti]
MIAEFPHEIRVRCFWPLEDLRDLISLSLVCQSFRSASEDDTLWEKQLSKVFGSEWVPQPLVPLKFVFIHTYKTRLKRPVKAITPPLSFVPELWRNDGAFLAECPVVQCNSPPTHETQTLHSISNVLIENMEDESLTLEEWLEKRKAQICLSFTVAASSAVTPAPQAQPKPENNTLTKYHDDPATENQSLSRHNTSQSPDASQIKPKKPILTRQQTSLPRKPIGDAGLKRGQSIFFRRPAPPKPITESSSESFQQILELPKCRDIKNAVESFIKTFDKKVKGMSLDAEAKVMMNFLSAAEYTLQTSSPWKEMPPDLFLLGKMSMKTYLFSHLYSSLFAKKALQEKDLKLAKHIRDLRSVTTPKHLEITANIDESLMQSSVKELEGLDIVVTPFEKITFVLNACKVLLFSLQSTGITVSADDFLPLFIYVVIQADLPRLASNISFIDRFTDPEERLGEAYCYYTHLVSAVTFIETMTPPITISRSEGSAVSQSRGSVSPRMPEDTPAISSSPSSVISWQPAKKLTSTTPSPRLSEEFTMQSPSTSPPTVQTIPSEIFAIDFDEERLRSPPNLGIHVSQEMLTSLHPTFLHLKIPICCITSLSTGEVWVGTGNGKVIVYHENTDYVSTIDVHTSPVHAICVDQGSAWCSSDEGALFHVAVNSHTFTHKVVVHDRLHQAVQLLMVEYLENNSTCILSVATSTISSQLVQLNSQTGEISNSVMLQHPVWCAVQHSSGVWIGCNRGCIIMLDYVHLTVQRELHLPSQYTHPVGSLAFSHLYLWVVVGGLLIAVDESSGAVLLSAGIINNEIPSTVCVKACADYLFTAHSSGKLACWDKRTGACLCSLNPCSHTTRRQQRIAEGVYAVCQEPESTACDDDTATGVRMALLEVAQPCGVVSVNAISLWCTFRIEGEEGVVVWR